MTYIKKRIKQRKNVTKEIWKESGRKTIKSKEGNWTKNEEREYH